MKSIITLFATLLALLLFSACSQESSQTRETSNPEVKEAPPASMAKQSPPAAEQAKQAKPLATEETEKVEQMVVDIEKEAVKQIEIVKEQAAAVTEQVKTATSSAVETVQKKASSALSELKTVVPAVTKSAAPAAEPPETLVYQASMGKVTFNHTEHAQRLECGKCHTTAYPQKIAIDKLTAHSLCAGCHKSSGGNAPTACTGCHKK